MPGKRMEFPENGKNNRQKALTCIRSAYTLAGTPNGGEVDKLMIEQFLKTLAEVSLSIASRNIGNSGSEKSR